MAILSRASAAFSAKVTDDGAAPSSTSPASVTETVTVSAEVVAPLRRNTNTAALPSVTGEAAAAIETSRSGAETVAVAALSSVSSVPPSSVKVTRTLTVLPASAAVSV